MLNKRNIVVALMALVTIVANFQCYHLSPNLETRTRNLRAFSKLYGYVRFFHPSERASSIDWSLFADYGSGRAIAARDSIELKNTLQELFRPLGADIEILFDGTKDEGGQRDSTGSQSPHEVAWQHRGVYLGNDEKRDLYNSARVCIDEPDSPRLFEHFPIAGEKIRKPLDCGLECVVPLTQPQTGGKADDFRSSVDYRQLMNLLDSVKSANSNGSNLSTHIADIVVAWNVMQHFYPYFEVVHVNWDSCLTAALEETLASQKEGDYYVILARMMARLGDGHGFADMFFQQRCSGNYHQLPFDVQYGLPAEFDWREGSVVVTTTFDSSCLKRGDVIEKVDGQRAEAEVSSWEDIVSGSPQWKRYQAMRFFGRVVSRRDATVGVLRNKEHLFEKIPRITMSQFHPHGLHAAVELVSPNVHYVSLSVVGEEYLEHLIQEYGNDPKHGFVFDARFGFSRIMQTLLPHLTAHPIVSLRWLVPQTTYPDHSFQEDYDDSSGRSICEPKPPLIKGKVELYPVFWTGC